jgi:precorrin-2 dehydrogenase/sirohydrochlorin ferrochelatase
MRYYPIFLNLARKKCLVVGAGQVGRRKIATLASCGALEVLVLDVAPLGPESAAILEHACVRFEQRPFSPHDLDGRFLVIASTSNEELNWSISRLCDERGIPCNIVDQPEKCSFIVPALFTQGDLTLAVSTGGSSPALARKIRRDLGEYFGTQYGAFLTLMGSLRPLVLGLGQGTDHNSELFRAIVESPLLDAIKGRDVTAALSILRGILPESLHGQLESIVLGVMRDDGR